MKNSDVEETEDHLRHLRDVTEEGINGCDRDSRCNEKIEQYLIGMSDGLLEALRIIKEKRETGKSRW